MQFVFLFFLSFICFAKKNMQTILYYSSEIDTKPSKVAPLNWPKPPPLTVTAKIEDENILVEALLKNKSTKPVAYLIQNANYTETNPFMATLVSDSNISYNKKEEIPPSLEEKSIQINIPAHTQILWTERIPLSHFTYKGSPTGTIHWSFSIAQQPPQKGTLKIQLPKKM